MLKWKIGDVTVTRVVEIELPGLTFILPDATPENVKPMTWLVPRFASLGTVPVFEKRILAKYESLKYHAMREGVAFGTRARTDRGARSFLPPDPSIGEE